MKSQPHGEAPWQSALRTARHDGPVAASQAAMWHDIERTVLNVSVPPKAPMSAGATVGPVKAAFLGAALGSALSVSAVAILFHWGTPAKVPTRDSAALRPEPLAALVAPIAPVTSATQGAQVGARSTAFGDPGSNGAALPSPMPRANAPVPALPSAPLAPAARVHTAHEHGEDPLSKEVELLTGARDAIARGDAGEALAMLRVMRNMPSRQLAPEGLALEARALRVLGRDQDADGLESQLRAAPPSHVTPSSTLTGH